MSFLVGSLIKLAVGFFFLSRKSQHHVVYNVYTCTMLIAWNTKLLHGTLYKYKVPHAVTRGAFKTCK